MSDELNNYLNNTQINIYKMIDGSTIIARLVEDDGEEIMVSKPQEVMLMPDGKSVQLIMNEWMYGSDEDEDIIIHHDSIMSYSSASYKMKKFYSKCILRNRLDDLADNLNLKSKTSDSSDSIETNPFEFLSSILDGLEPKDSSEDEKAEEYKEENDFQKRRWEWPSELD